LRLHIVCREVPKELKTGKLEPQRLVALLRDQTKDTTSYRDKLLGCITGALICFKTRSLMMKTKLGFRLPAIERAETLNQSPPELNLSLLVLVKVYILFPSLVTFGNLMAILIYTSESHKKHNT